MKVAHFIRSRPGFTLIEMLVSMAILAVILILMTKIIDATGKTWQSTTGKLEQFRDARQGFESITRRLSQATLNTYLDYDWVGNTPKRYMRQSELRFISGSSKSGGDKALLPGSIESLTHSVFFQAPLGYTKDPANAHLKNVLNTCGYWLEYLSDETWRPDFLKGRQNPPSKKRYRLMELMEPSEAMNVYTYTSGTDGSGNARASTYKGKDWFRTSVALAPTERPAHSLADNVVGLILLPKLTKQDGYADDALAPSYLYDSTKSDVVDPKLNPENQLPPIVQVTMVAVDEASFSRRYTDPEAAAPDFGMAEGFTTAADYEKDLKTFTDELSKEHLVWRVFTTNVSIRAAKWSAGQSEKQ